MNEEKWKPILNWPEYEISTEGRVRGKHGLINPFPVLGYLAFNVCRGDKFRRSLRVHREVARSHLGDLPGKVVRHLDGNPLNCRLDNLAWGTHKDNEEDKRKHDRSLLGERHHQAKLSEPDVLYIRGSVESGVVLAKRFHVTPTNIGYIRKRKSWRHL